jgi:hypothetical protein
VGCVGFCAVADDTAGTNGFSSASQWVAEGATVLQFAGPMLFPAETPAIAASAEPSQTVRTRVKKARWRGTLEPMIALPLPLRKTCGNTATYADSRPSHPERGIGKVYAGPGAGRRRRPGGPEGGDGGSGPSGDHDSTPASLDRLEEDHAQRCIGCERGTNVAQTWSPCQCLRRAQFDQLPTKGFRIVRTRPVMRIW